MEENNSDQQPEIPGAESTEEQPDPEENISV